MNDSSDVEAVLDRVVRQGSPSSGDLEALRGAIVVTADPDRVQVGKYVVNIKDASEFHVGDRIYRGPSAQTIKDLLQEVLAGERDSELASSLRRFLAAQRVACDAVPYVALRNRATLPPLTSIYIEQRAEQHVPKPAPESSAEEGSDPTATALEATDDTRSAAIEPSLRTGRPEEALERHRHLLLEGGPGSGKSTLLNHLVLSLSARLEQDPSAAIVPVRVSAPSLAAQSGPFASSLRAAVSAELRYRLDVELDNRLFAGAPAPQQTWLVLVDALDEVVNEAKRQQLLDAVADHASRDGSPYRFVVTTRPVGEVPQLATDDFGRYVLREFDFSQVKAFAGTWFSVRGGSEADAEQFLERISASPVAGLAQVPLLLTMAALVYERDRSKELPTRRAGLYKSFVEMLSETGEADRQTLIGIREEWRARYGHEGEQWVDLLLNRRRDLLEFVAERRQQGVDAPLLSMAVDYVYDQQLVPSSTVQQEWLEAQLRTVLLRSGLVAYRNGTEAFVHDTFREYLAGSCIARSHPPDHARARALIGQWKSDGRNVVLFALGIWSDRGLDATPVIEPIFRSGPKGVLFAGQAFAEGVRLSPELETAIIQELLELAKVQHLSLLGGDALSTLASLPDSDLLAAGLRALASESTRPYGRSRAAQALGAIGRKSEAISLLSSMAIELKDRVLFPAAAALVDLGEADTARDIARAVALEPDAGADRRIEAADVLGFLGEAEVATTVLLEIAKDPPADAHLRVQLGRALVFLGRHDQALAVLRAAASDTSVDLYGRGRAAEVLAEVGSPEEAMVILKDLAHDPTSRRGANTYIAEVLSRLGGEDEAIEVLSAVVTDPAADDMEKRRAAKVLARLGRTDDAVSVLGRLAERPGLEAYERAWAAQDLASISGPDEALVIARRVLRDRRTPKVQVVELAKLLGERGLLREELVLLKGVAKRLRPLSEAKREVANRFWELGMEQEAVTLLRRIARNPFAARLERQFAAENLASYGFRAEALVVLRRLARLRTNSFVRVSAADALSKLGAREEAIASLRRSASTRRMTVQGRIRIAEAMADLGLQAEAVSILQGLPRGGSHATGVALALGRLKGTDAARSLLVDVASDPKVEAWTRVFAASSLASIGLVEEATRLLTELARSRETPPRARTDAARTLGDMMRRDEAIVTLREVVEDQATDASIRIDAALLLAGYGFRPDARDILSDLAADPSVYRGLRVRAAQAVHTVGYTAEAVGLLEAMTKNRRTRHAAAKALAEVRG